MDGIEVIKETAAKAVTQQVEVDYLGTEYTPKKVFNRKASVKNSLRELLKDIGFEKIAELLKKIEGLEAKLGENDEKKIQELMQKIKEITGRFGLRFELILTKESKQLVRIFDKITNRQVTTIPLHILLRILMARGTGELDSGETSQSFGLNANLTQTAVITDILA